MKARKGVIFLIVLLCFILLMNIPFVCDRFMWSRKNIWVVEGFQQLVYGLGMGASKTPTWCYINYDSRIEPVCTCIEWPVPGGYCYCPDHSGTISFFEDDAASACIFEIR